MQDELHFGERFVRCYIDRPRHVFEILQRSAERAPHNIAAICQGRRFTFATVAAEAARIAAGLAGDGVRPGDRVAFLLGARAEAMITLFAIWRLGAIATPIDARLVAGEIGHILSAAGAVAIIYEGTLADRLPPSSATPSLRRRYVLDPMEGNTDLNFSALGLGLIPPPPALPAEDDLAIIAFTSGTTGKPKGVMVAHLNVIHSVRHYELAWGLGPADKSLLCIPASNITGIVAIIVTLTHAGGCVVFMPVFKAHDFIALAAQERITHAFMVPAMYKLCLMSPVLDQHDLSSWILGSFGGAAMPRPTAEELAQRLPRLRLMNGYGATETASPASLVPLHLLREIGGTAGIAVPCGDIRIVDPANGHDLPCDTAGEVWIKGPMVSPGYWNDPTATSQAFVDGYWRSGDIGAMDERGVLRILDRLKDSINRGGYKIYSAEVENILNDHPDVMEVAVIGRPDPVLGERVHAVIRRRTMSLSLEILRAFCSERMADYKTPESFTLIDEPLQRNQMGKVVKRQLRDQLFGVSSSR